MKRICSLLLALFLAAYSLETLAQALTYPQQQKVNQLFKNSKVVYFKFAVRSMQEMPHFSKILSVDKTNGLVIFAHADKAQFTNFIKMNIGYTVLPPPKKAGAKPKPKSGTKPAAKKTPVKK